MTITPYFDSSITSAGDAAQVEGAINTAIATIDSLYSNTGVIGIVFSQASGSFLGESQTADYTLSYSSYKSDLTAVSVAEPTNTVLSTALAHLASGNDANGAKNVVVTLADAKLALGLSGVTGCFNTSGSFVGGCGQSYYGVVTLSTSYTLNYGTAAVSGENSAVNIVEHELDEMLGGGGQGSTLNAVYDGTSPVNGDVGVLDFYRYSATGVPSFTTSSSAVSYLSVDGGATDIVGFNQTNSSSDFGDFSTCDNIQSSNSCSGLYLAYNASSPEYAMLEAIGYNGTVPEPGSMLVLGSGLAGLFGLGRRAAARRSRLPR